MYLGVTLLPMAQISLPPPLPEVLGLPRAAEGLASALQPLHVSSSYGLFRRMTGVGHSPRGTPQWGGAPASVVEVPAVVVEGSPDGGHAWSEIPFRYAPFTPERAPRYGVMRRACCPPPPRRRVDWTFPL